ncbi:MAG: metallophosphoesterase, partial [Firmicutes bacterium]|nr:metallophosphoesterase [Bacillota bacterium]
MANTVKILHTGDVHLDSPFSGLDPDRAAERKAELRAAFDSLLSFVSQNGVDILLIAGDLFDSGFATHDTVELLKSGFARIPGCRVIISPGNHDPYTR